MGAPGSGWVVGAAPPPSLSIATFLHNVLGDQSSSILVYGDGNLSSGVLKQGADTEVSPSQLPGRADAPSPSLLLGLPRGQGLP